MDLTIIITASYIPTHPSIELMYQVLSSLKLLKLPDNTKIILAHDYNDKQDYKKYLENLEEYIKDFPNISMYVRKDRGYLVGNIENVIDKVDTKYMLILQHDLPFINQVEIDINKVILDMENNKKLKHIRFSIFNNNKVNKKTSDCWNNLYGEQVEESNYTYTRTPFWSDQNHLTTLDYYKEIILPETKGEIFMENKLMYKSSNEEIHNKYGTYIYGPMGQKRTILHLDGAKIKYLWWKH